MEKTTKENISKIGKSILLFLVWIIVVIIPLFLADGGILPQYIAIIITIVIGISGPICLIYYLFKKKSRWRYAGLLLILVLLFRIMRDPQSIFRLYFWFGSIEDVLITVLGILIFVLIFRNLGEFIADNFQGKTLKESAEKFVDSNALLKAFEESLPIGQTDIEHGFDYVKYMLLNVERRRERFENKARLYLITFFVLAIIFCSFVGYAGYIILNEDSTGLGRILNEVNFEMNQIERIHSATTSQIMDKALFKRDCSPAIEKLLNSEISGEVKEFQKKILLPAFQIANDNPSEGNIDNLIKALDNLKEKFDKSEIDKETYWKYSANLNNALAAVEHYKENYINQIKQLPVLVGKLKNKIKDINVELIKSDNRIPELVKRFGISIIVGTLFLSVLRFFGKLYQQNYSEILNAQRDELVVRRTAVSLMATKDDTEGRRAIAIGLLNAIPSRGIMRSEDTELAESKQEEGTNLLKTLLDLLSKK